MSNLYLVDQPFASNALAIAADDSDALVVLIQDGVYADLTPLAKKNRLPVYGVAKDIERRGLGKRLEKTVQPIGFDKLVDLIIEHKVINFA
jgi:sulfur relay protein TusB/DsrH